MTDKLKPCPKCGKDPRIKVQHSVASVTVIIQCKPFLRDPHMYVRVNNALFDTAAERAVKRWNDRADCANLPVW